MYEDVKNFLFDKGIKIPAFPDFKKKFKKDSRYLFRISKGLLNKKNFQRWLGEQHYKNNNQSFVYAQLYPGVKDMLSKLYKQNLKMILTSAWFGLESTKKALKREGVINFFQSILTLENFIQNNYSKPPKYNSRKIPFIRSVRKKSWLLFESLKILKTPPELTVMVGDSPEDIKAGKKARTKTVALLTGTGKKYLSTFEKMNPDHIIESVNQLPEIIKKN
jgi:phosphoglycolate phosphatase-like HAD superfamily hydrolase